jgi:creatinine amidohydrolase/Fe(II)-dependent formamide hydrolase-like protein
MTRCHLPLAATAIVLRATAEAIARKLGDALVAPAIPFEPGNFKQRQDTGTASINGQTLLPLETTIANGRKLVEIRANVTVEAIRKALAPK